MQKPTRATFEAFIRRNLLDLEIYVEREFDGMVDGCAQVNDGWRVLGTAYDKSQRYTLGLPPIYLVGNSRDYFQSYDGDSRKGYRVYNCRGAFRVAVKAMGAAQ